MKTSKHLILVACLVSTLISCFSAAKPKIFTEEDLTPVNITSILVDGETIAIPDSMNSSKIEAKSLCILRPSIVEIRSSNSGIVFFDGLPISMNSKFEFSFKRISKDVDVVIKFKNTEGKISNITLSTHPLGLPAFSFTASNPKPGICLVAPRSNLRTDPGSTLLAINQSGQIVFYKQLATRSNDFKHHALSDGREFYSVFIQDQPASLSGVGYMEGSIHIMDSGFREITTVRLLGTSKHLPMASESHDFIMLGEDHYILCAYLGKTIYNLPPELMPPSGKSNVVAAIIQEIKGGKVVMEWDSTDYPEFYSASKDDNDFANAKLPWADYMHMNSVQLDKRDGNIVVSFRNIHQVVKINRANGAIIWRLSGTGDMFGLSMEQQTSGQHHARFQADGRLMVFDNGDEYRRTRILLYGLDEVNSKLLSFTAFYPLNGVAYSNAMGSSQLLDDAIFIGWGSKASGAPDVSEHNLVTGETTFTLRFDSPNLTSYRAFKVAAQGSLKQESVNN